MYDFNWYQLHKRCHLYYSNTNRLQGSSLILLIACLYIILYTVFPIYIFSIKSIIKVFIKQYSYKICIYHISHFPTMVSAMANLAKDIIGVNFIVSYKFLLSLNSNLLKCLEILSMSLNTDKLCWFRNLYSRYVMSYLLFSSSFSLEWIRGITLPRIPIMICCD